MSVCINFNLYREMKNKYINDFDNSCIGIVDIVCTTGERLVKNQDIENKYSLASNYIFRRTGIEQRYYRANETDYTELALKSARQIMTRNNISVTDLIAVICTSSTYDRNSPSLSCRIMNELDRNSLNEYCTTFDISAACTGYIYALEMALEKLQFRKNEVENKYVLIVTNEAFSDFISHPSSPFILFSDASSATLIELSSTVKSNWKAKINNVITGSSRDLGKDNQVYMSDGVGKIDMNGPQVFESAVKKMTKAIQEICSKIEFKTEEINLYILHQANKKIIDTISRNIEHKGIFYSNIDRYGNTGTNSIPLCLENIFSSGIVRGKSTKTVLASFGFGFTHGAAYIELLENNL